MNDAIHCHYCNAPLYQMQWNRTNLAIRVDDKQHYYNSDNNRICAKCDESLIRRGSKIECVCGEALYEITTDKFKSVVTLLPEELKGINGQYDPVYGVKHRCVHCNDLIEWG